MRKLCICLFSLLLCSACMTAKVKVVETSGKAPKWIYAVEQEYIIVSAESASLEDAKNKCMLQVKKQILASVAENVQSSSAMDTREIGVNGKYSIMEQYASMVETKSAQIPFLSEVSITKAEGFYWEKLKNDKEYSYRYHIKYPFGKFDLLRMVDDFQSKERALDNQLADFVADDFSQYTSVEQMIARVQELKLFKASLMEGDSRLERCQNVERVYGEYIRSIQLRLIRISKEELVFSANFREKALTMAAQPKLKSNCLSNIQYQSRGTECVVTYDYATCTDEQTNFIDVSFNVGGNKVKKRFTIQ
ncbi:MAG: hypothetical protein MJZ53_06320 [Paludibacteraceae bacterium]|nr:hypothetical protein [Paludibacteraceae bacterium]